MLSTIWFLAVELVLFVPVILSTSASHPPSNHMLSADQIPPGHFVSQGCNPVFARPLRFAKGANQIRQRNVSHNTWQRHTWKHQMPSQCGKLSNHLLRVTNHLLLRMLCDLVSRDVALLRYMLKNEELSDGFWASLETYFFFFRSPKAATIFNLTRQNPFSPNAL